MAETIIRDNMSNLEALTAELLRKEVLTGDEIDRVMNGKSGGASGQSSRRPGSRRRRRRSPAQKHTDQNGAENQKETAQPVADKEAAPVKQPKETDRQAAAHPEPETEQEQPVEKKRPSRRRRKPAAAKPVPEGEIALESAGTGDGDQKQRPEAKKEGRGGSSSKKSDDGGQTSGRRRSSARTRMIRLKTGGRQRTIRKAPAKKVRTIN